MRSMGKFVPVGLVLRFSDVKFLKLAGSFAARAQSAAAKNMNAGKVAGWEASKHSGQSKGSGGHMRGGGKK